MDLFIGGRVIPGSYPKPVSSFILRNDSKNGIVKFTDATAQIAPGLQNIGLVTDAVWSDVDNNGTTDLLISGEWMNIKVLKNENGKLSITKTNLDDQFGWWNSISAADVDNDGDMDYIVGNCGTNSFLKPSQQYPVKGYAKDFDGNGTYNAVYSSYLPVNVFDTNKKEFPIGGRDDLVREMNVMRNRFPNYSLFAKTEINNFFSNEDLKDALQLSANNFNSCWIENKGNLPTGQAGFEFAVHALPAQAQWAPVYGIVCDDFNNDGNIDIALNGNEFSMSPLFGRCDALNGLILQGDGKGNFNPLSIQHSGFYVPGNGKALVQLIVNNKLTLAAAQNSSVLKLFQTKNKEEKIIKLQPDDVTAVVQLKNGQKRKEEFIYGSSFLSQSARFIRLNAAVQSIEITNNKKQKRIINN